MIWNLDDLQWYQVVIVITDLQNENASDILITKNKPMRPIKFRWKSIETWEFVFWNLLYWAWDCQIWEIDNEWARHNYSCDTETVWQFTWLTDKNWVEIYENDIIREYSDTASGFWPDNLVYEIRYHWDWFYFFNPVLNTIISNWKLRNHCKFYEVIWNVYQNPEILTIK